MRSFEGSATAVAPAARSATAAQPRKPSLLLLLLLLGAAASLVLLLLLLLPMAAAARSDPPAASLLLLLLPKTAGVSCVAAALDVTHLQSKTSKAAGHTADFCNFLQLLNCSLILLHYSISSSTCQSTIGRSAA
jgi:hypothetical protein